LTNQGHVDGPDS